MKTLNKFEISNVSGAGCANDFPVVSVPTSACYSPSRITTCDFTKAYETPLGYVPVSAAPDGKLEDMIGFLVKENCYTLFGV